MLTKLSAVIVAGYALIGQAHAASAGKLACHIQDTSGNRLILHVRQQQLQRWRLLWRYDG
jgi:hypothetical protein